MAITITFANQKGGVGKTLTTSSVARIMTIKGYKVLAVDMDPQRNLSMFGGRHIAIEPDDEETLSVLDVLEGRCAAQDAIIETPLGDLLRASSFLTQWNSALAIDEEEYRRVRADPLQLREFYDQKILHQADKQAKLYQGLRSIQSNYDFVLIDTNPSLTLVTMNCIYAADGIVIPAFCERSSMEAVKELINTVDTIFDSSTERDMKILGILMTKCEKRTALYKKYETLFVQFAEQFYTKVFDTKIRKSARAADAMDSFTTLVDRDRRGPATQDYINFTDELLSEIEINFRKGVVHE